MWRMTARLATATLTATLAFTALNAPQAGAAAVQSYNYWTDGSIAGQTGVAPISFSGTGNYNYSFSNTSLTTPGTFSLGQIDAANILPASATLTYNNTPFTIDLHVSTTAGTGYGNPYYTYVIHGNLNGSITGAGSSNMVATLGSVTGMSDNVNGIWTTPPFPASAIQINFPQGINAPNINTNTDGVTTLYAQVLVGPGLPAPAPEPASIAIFGVGLVAWGVRRKIARSKRPAIA